MKKKWIPLVSLLLGGMSVGAWGAEGAETDTATPSDAVVLGEEDLADRAEILRNMYRRITPPDIPLVQDAGTWPAAWEEFGAEWESAAAEREYGAWVVPVEVSQEAGETVVRDGNGAILWRGRTDFARPESSDVVLTGGLVAEEEWAVYEGVREAVARLESAGGTPAPPVRSNHTNGLRFTSHEWTTNGTFRLELAYETDTNVDIFAYAVACTSSLVVATWTNDENQVIMDTNTVWTSVGLPFNGMESDWVFRGTVAISNGVAVFEDGGFPDTLSRQRFYAAVVAQDTDGDGLNDGWESFVYHTDSTVADSDGDGWGDGMEVAVGFNPADAGAVPKLTIRGVMYDPSGTDGGKEWVELYSASPTTLPLEGFRLEVGRGGVWSNVLEFASGASIAPWRCLLVGESGVTNADVQATLQIPNAMSNAPTTGVRLRWNGATNGAVADAVFIGRNPSFNTNHLDATGWLSLSSVWSYAGKVVERRFPGLDTDQAADWCWENARSGQDSTVAIDSDGDGLPDADECTGSRNPFGGPTNPWNADSDGDGLGDYAECVTHGTDPNTWATDGDIWPWMPAGTPATNWPGSDSWELLVTTNNNPLEVDANTNGIPDSWEAMLDMDSLLNGGDTDGDGISDWDEMQQNSNPLDDGDSVAQPYVIRYESSHPGWMNTGMCDVGLQGWVRMCFEGLQSDYDVAAWVEEGREVEEFSVSWGALGEQPVQVEDPQHAMTVGHLSAGTRPYLQVQDLGMHPNYVNTLGGEYRLDSATISSVRLVGAPANGLIVSKGGMVTMSATLHPASYAPPAGEPKWEYQQLKLDGTWTEWTSFDTWAFGTTYAHLTTLSGVFRVRAVLHVGNSLVVEKVFDRTCNEEYGFGRIGEPDAFGVVDAPIQISIANAARNYLGSTDYPYGGTVPAAYGFPVFPSNTYKCSIFVAHRAVEAGAVVPAINGSLFEYPPLANEWAGVEDTKPWLPGFQNEIEHWLLETTPYLQPGFIIAHPEIGDHGHVAIVDYDGQGIGAGFSGTVNKKNESMLDGTSGLRRYVP